MTEEQLKISELEQRMYCLVLYNLSPIQQGIQAAHAIVEYANAFQNTIEYQKWAQVNKTIIILNGGTSGTMKTNMDHLIDNELCDLAFFKEPDLYNGITAISFLADERIWDREKYPDEWTSLAKHNEGIQKGSMSLGLGHIFDQNGFVESIGGEKNHQLKLFLQKFRLA